MANDVAGVEPSADDEWVVRGCPYARRHADDPILPVTAEGLAELERMRQPGGPLDPAVMSRRGRERNF